MNSPKGDLRHCYLIPIHCQHNAELVYIHLVKAAFNLDRLDFFLALFCIFYRGFLFDTYPLNTLYTYFVCKGAIGVRALVECSKLFDVLVVQVIVH